MISLSNGTVETVIPVQPGPYFSSFSPDGKYLYVSSPGEKVITVIRADSADVIDVLHFEQKPYRIFTGKERMFVTTFQSNLLYVLGD